MERKKTEGNAERDCMPERLNRLGEWFVSEDKGDLITISDRKAVLK